MALVMAASVVVVVVLVRVIAVRVAAVAGVGVLALVGGDSPRRRCISWPQGPSPAQRAKEQLRILCLDMRTELLPGVTDDLCPAGPGSIVRP